jgi:hypothetical protein
MSIKERTSSFNITKELAYTYPKFYRRIYPKQRRRIIKTSEDFRLVVQIEEEIEKVGAIIF